MLHCHTQLTAVIWRGEERRGENNATVTMAALEPAEHNTRTHSKHYYNVQNTVVTARSQPRPLSIKKVKGQEVGTMDQTSIMPKTFQKGELILSILCLYRHKACGLYIHTRFISIELGKQVMRSAMHTWKS